MKCAFTAGCRTSAAAQTFVSRSLTVGFVSPSCSRATSRSRNSSARVMSTERVSWKTGACQASVSRRAIVFRVEVSAISSTSPVAAARTAAGAAVGCGDDTALDVLGDDPALGAAALELGDVDSLLAREPARERRGLDATLLRHRGFGDRSGGGLCGRGGSLAATLALVVHLVGGRAFLLRLLVGLGGVLVLLLVLASAG